MDSPDTLVQLPHEHGEQPAARRIAPRARASPAEPTPRAQELVLERYRLLERLGKGGFGVVWRAHDELLHREVALKRVLTGGTSIDVERASREALATARLTHPAIVALHEACAHDGAFYLISELVDGDTLAQLIADDVLADEEILEIGAALASALIHAHSRGVIHRDIKPHNVLVPHPPVDDARAQQTLLAAAKLTDFGGASLAGEDALTRTGDVLGTLAYMSPEQSEGREAGPQSDLYSLALVVYEAFCGVNPVRGATPAATARRIGQPLPALARARRDLPPTLTVALDRALAPAPEQRGTLEQLHDAFEHTLTRGLRQPRRLFARPPAERPPAERLPAERPPPEGPPAERLLTERPPAERPHVEHQPPRVALPRAAWLGSALALAAWQLAAGRPGVALLALSAIVPALMLSGRRSGAGWLSCGLAPALGYIGLAGAFPALAGQAARWRQRAVLGAVGYWWLRLAEPLSATRLWLTATASTPARASWEPSLSLTATHVIAPLLSTGVLLGALLWAAAAAVLPWLVRGRSALRDLLAAGAWVAALVLAQPTLDAGLSARAAHVEPRAALLGALVGGLVAVAARALRGPV